MNEKKENGQWETVYSEETARPSWITDELMIQTKRVWQKFYATPLTETELVEIIVGVGWIFN